MRILPFFVVAAAAICLSACLPPSTSHPIGSTVGLANDPVLKGMWRGDMDHSDEKRPVYFHFIQRSDNTITVVMSADEPDGGWSTATITTSMLAGRHFMNAVLTNSDGKEDKTDPPLGTIPLIYKVDGPRKIEMAFLDEAAIKAAIAAHRIAGTAGDGQYGDAVITAEPKDLDAFFSDPKNAALFNGHFANLTKVE